MKKGDHLRVCFGWYQHHGICLGGEQIIHFGRGLHDLSNASVEIVSSNEFSKGRRIEVVESKAIFSAEEITNRAKSRMDERNYDLFDNNCEHFVNWCRSGVGSSPQIEASESFVRGATAVAVKPVLRRFVGQKLAKVSASKLALRLSTRTTGAAILGDATQAVAEMVAISIGKEKTKARRIGLGTGAVTSAALGTAIGGPVGGAATFSMWLVGQAMADQAVERGKQAISQVARAFQT